MSGDDMNTDEFDEIEESLLSYKRFMKQVRFTVVNPMLIGMSLAFGMSAGSLSSIVDTINFASIGLSLSLFVLFINIFYFLL
jgi:hypothetical protein